VTEVPVKTAKELWAGDVPLCPAFWIYGFTVELMFKWAMRWLYSSGHAGDSVFVFVGGLAVVYSAFAMVAIWRSASRFEGHGGWAWAARIGAIVWPMGIFWGP
jgi:hypothetical protein